MHWGYELSQRDADVYIRKKRLPKLPPGPPAVDFATHGLPAGAAAKSKSKPGGSGKRKASDITTTAPKRARK